MASLSPYDFQMLVEQMGGDEDAARAMLKQRGYTVEGEEAADLAVRPDMTALQGIIKGQRESIGDLYDKITQNIQQRYRAPDINDLLVAVGTSMLTPPSADGEGGFRGSIMRGLQGVGQFAQSRRAYDTELNKMMSQVEIQKAKDLADLEAKYATGAASLLKPRSTSSTASPVTVGPDLVTRSRRYGTTIKEPPQEAIYTLQSYLQDPTNTPQNKVIAKRNFDSKFGYGASEIYGGEQ